MSNRRFHIAALLGIIGYGLLFLLAPRVNPIADWNYRLDRETAIARARQVAGDFGVDASNWRAYVGSRYQRSVNYYLDVRRSPAPEDSRVSSAIVTVFLVEPTQGAQRFRVNLTTDGRLDGIEQRFIETQTNDARPRNEAVRIELGENQGLDSATPQSNAAGSASNPNAAPSDSQSKDADNSNADEAIVAEARGVADDALRRLVGDAASEFVFLTSKKDKLGKREGVRFEWDRSYAEAPDLKVRATARIFDRQVIAATLTQDFTPAYKRELDNRENVSGFLYGVGVLFIVLVFIALPFFYFFGLLKRRIRQRSALILLGVVFLFSLVSNSIRSFDTSIIENAFSSGSVQPLVQAIFKTLTISFFYALGFAVIWGVGFTFARRGMPLRSASFVALLRGRITKRFVGDSIASGVLLGGALAAIPYIIKATNLLPGLEINRTSPDIFVAYAPGIAALLQPFGLGLFALYGFLAPLMSVSRRAAKIARVLLPLLACFLLFDSLSRLSSGAGIIVATIILAVFIDTIFRRYDLLTLMIALLSAEAALAGVSLFATNLPTLRSSGFYTFALLAFTLLAAVAVRLRGRDDAIEDEIKPDPVDELSGSMQAERERLVAEFGVARLAQQRMLPDSPPRIPGYDIAAICRPAREVGGDLYDFLRLPDERIGIVVADVSGKGVPAALYMTLTKGLLASVSETETDPHRILAEVNRHLYEVCRRKVFVTLILGVLDPATRTLHLARAGHNPTVWRRVRADDVKGLRAPGLGLGLNKGMLFDRTLKIETINLEAGDAVLFYSDGITEAMNSEREEYGDERLMRIVRQTDGMSAAGTEEVILTDVYGFLGDESPQDDITLVVLRVAAN
jgi:serine phosphatase RsbU (regulator of sigma subunit)